MTCILISGITNVTTQYFHSTIHAVKHATSGTASLQNFCRPGASGSQQRFAQAAVHLLGVDRPCRGCRGRGCGVAVRLPGQARAACTLRWWVLPPLSRGGVPAHAPCMPSVTSTLRHSQSSVPRAGRIIDGNIYRTSKAKEVCKKGPSMKKGCTTSDWHSRRSHSSTWRDNEWPS